MPGTSLPPLVPQRVQDRLDVVSAYNMLRRLETTILAEIDHATSSVVTDVDLMYCRIVGHFFHHVPSDRGLGNLVREVGSTNGDRQKLLDVGKLYYDHAFRLSICKRTDSFAISSSFSPIIQYRGRNDQEHAGRGLNEPRDSKEKGVLKALVRDGFRCVISGRYDRESVRRSRVLDETPGIEVTETECAHILSESTNVVGIGEGSSKTDYAPSAWAVLSRFGSREILPKELNGRMVHRLENVITMCHDAHCLFDRLEMWLGPTDTENVYNVRAIYPRDLVGYQQVITFNTDNPRALPVPSREYLVLHAACAKVAHLSAATEYMDSVIREIKETLVLSSDGASAAVLEHAIWTAQRELVPV
ncbi:hypothetical protein APHAL10511_001397 [Amanita phalloides]|nr:hypothetical protein APHAL10511_001397 [Amanita phalloides]